MANNKWHYLGRWIEPVLSMCFWCHWNRTNALKEIVPFISFKPLLALDGHTLQQRSDLKFISQLSSDLIKAGQVDGFVKQTNELGARLANEHLAVTSNTYTSTKQYLSALFKIHQEVVSFWFFMAIMGDEIQSRILSQQIAKSEQELLAMIKGIMPNTWLENHLEFIKNIAISEQIETREVQTKIKQHVRDFAWMGTHHWVGEKYTSEKCIDEIKQLSIEPDIPSTKALEQEQAHPLIRLMASTVYWRTHCAEVSAKAILYSRPRLAECAQGLGIDYDSLVYLSAQEILGLLTAKQNGDTWKLPDDLGVRESKFGYIVDKNNNGSVITGTNLERLFKHTIQQNDNANGGELFGQVANAGRKLTGKVKVLRSPKDFHDFESGDVLVASETSPDFISCMSKASAILTERGGITSHAAIVSRELGKPCVIGIKGLLSSVRDGDVIEVDANNGVIKILQGNQEGKEYVFMWSLAPSIPGCWATPHALTERSDIWPDADNFYYFDGKVITSYMEKNQIEEYRQIHGKKYLDAKIFEEYRHKYEEEKQAWWRWIRQIEKKDYTTASREELKTDHLSYTNYIRDAIAYFATTRPELTFAAEQELEQILRGKYGNRWPEIFGTLTTSTKTDDIQKEQLEWLKLVQQSPNNQVLLEHASRFPWLVFGQFNDDKVLEFLEERLTQSEGSDYQTELDEYNARKDRLLKEQKRILSELGQQTERAKYLAELLQTQSFERMEIKSYWAGCYYLARNMWNAIVATLSISLSDVMAYIAPPEIQTLLAGTYDRDITEELGKRRQYYAFDHVKGQDIKILNGMEARRAFEERIKPTYEATESIKGQTASLGKYTGRVRKVIAGDLDMLQGSIKVFEPGEVLVTSMTQPNMMVIAKRAGAIITDEGGITSHAAIISRELGIPCVVGCLNAMEALEDGDLIEVNANESEIHVIARADINNTQGDT